MNCFMFESFKLKHKPGLCFWHQGSLLNIFKCVDGIVLLVEHYKLDAMVRHCRSGKGEFLFLVMNQRSHCEMRTACAIANKHTHKHDMHK